MEDQHKKTHIYSILQLVFGLLALLIVFLLTVVVGIMGLASAVTAPNDVAGFVLLSLAWTGLVVFVILALGTGTAGLRLVNKDLPFSWKGDPTRLLTVLLFTEPIWLFIGASVAEWGGLAVSLLLPPVQLLVLGIPLAWTIHMGQRGLKGGVLQRKLGMISYGMAVSPIVIFLAEVIFLLFALIGLGVWFGTDPEMAEQMSRLVQRLVIAEMDPEAISRIVEPYLSQPLVLVIVFVFIAGLVALVEEFLKPALLWLLSWRKITPAEGFVAGMYCGAGFAFIETQGMLVNAVSTNWMISVIGRLGTNLLHTVTAGLVGWGLAAAWSQRRYLAMAGAYLLTVSLHGVWNAFGLLLGLAPFIPEDIGPLRPVLISMGENAPLMLIGLSVFTFMLLLGWNRYLRGQNKMEAAVVTILENVEDDEGNVDYN